MAREDLPYRKGVGIMLFNAQGLVFVAKRIDMTSEAWQMPQGGIDEGEDPEVAAFRELKEETGVSNATLMARSRGWLRYDLPDELVPLIWKGQYRGQEQLWFAMRLDGQDAEIDIAGEHAEFSEWTWTEVSNLPDLIVPFKRDLYSELVQEFGHLAQQS
jgi:putative (di)nucleoside polyphosphate hydrolase